MDERAPVDSPEPGWEGLDWKEPMKNLALAALLQAQEDGLILALKFPTDTRAPDQMERLRRHLGEDVPLPPADSGFYYLVHIAGPDGDRNKVLYGEDEVAPAMFVLALVMGGPQLARKYEFRRGMLS